MEQLYGVHHKMKNEKEKTKSNICILLSPFALLKKPLSLVTVLSRVKAELTQSHPLHVRLVKNKTFNTGVTQLMAYPI
jgi:hypothetical protein